MKAHTLPNWWVRPARYTVSSKREHVTVPRQKTRVFNLFRLWRFAERIMKF
jgi:hypothetical protein